MNAYVYASAFRLLRSRRPQELLAGRGAAGGDAAGRQPSDSLAREAALGEAARPLGGAGAGGLGGGGEPTEAGQRLYRAAQRMLALEGQLLDELAGDDDVLRGELALGASTGP